MSAGLLLATLLAAPARADEISELKAAVQALQKRIDVLEAQARSAEETDDRQTDQIAQARSTVGSWVGNFTWKGDFRYRNENIEQQYVADRNRDRIRARAGFAAKVNDTIRTEFMLATAEGGDPRSSNQTLGGENTRKGVYVDQAYVEWQPLADWKFTAGKMKYPWLRPGHSQFFDGDINPEGLAVNFTHGDFFASSFYNLLEERGAAGESTMVGGQLGWKPQLGPGQLVAAAGVFDLNSVRGRNPFYNGISNGNTTTTVACITGSPCLLNDYNLLELSAEYGFAAAWRPLWLYADYMRNDAARNGLGTAWSAGLSYGKAANPRSWEIAWYYQDVEKDALYGQYIDSDWGAGNTDARGHALKFGYALAKNWVFNATYMFLETNVDVAADVAGRGKVFDRDYQRLQLDFNFKY
jgi:type II secretory pathway pseudopilin PulG